MKFLHTSDWHLGAKLGEYSRLSEQREVLDEIRRIADAEAADFIIIAGDVFDNFNPSNEAVELLYRELKKLADDGRRPVIVIAGNHDSPDRIEAPDPLAAECGIFFIGYPDFTRADILLESGVRVCFPEPGIAAIDLPERPQVRILTTPYANENRLRKYLETGTREQQLSEILSESWKRLAEAFCDAKGVNILTAHLFMAAADSEGAENPAEPEDERSILHPGGLELIYADLVPGQIQYTALGHLHRPQTIRSDGGAVVYSGSPLAFGLSEEDQQKSVVSVEIEPGGIADVKRVLLESGRRILRKTFADTEQAVQWLKDNQNCYVELLMECDKYISAESRKRLFETHDGITAVIPVSRFDGSAAGTDGGPGREMPDLSDSIEELFISYFGNAKGVQPGADIISLFREISAASGGSE